MSAKITLKNAISTVGVVVPKFSSISSMPGDADVGTLAFNTSDGFMYVFAPKNISVNATDKEWKKVPPITS
jgi:hypothetical protein